MPTKEKSTTTAYVTRVVEEKWDDWAETAWRVGSLGTHQIAKLSREAYKSALRKAILNRIDNLRILHEHTSIEYEEYLSSTCECENMLKLLDTVSPE